MKMKKARRYGKERRMDRKRQMSEVRNQRSEVGARIYDCLPAIALAVPRYAKFKHFCSGEAGGSIEKIERSDSINHKSSIQRGQSLPAVSLAGSMVIAKC